MLIKAIGDASAILSCTLIGLVNYDGILSKSDILLMTRDYFGNSDFKMVSRELPNPFVCDDPMTFSHIIFYESELIPIGFYELGSPIDMRLLGITSLILDFTDITINSEVHVDLNVSTLTNYQAHVASRIHSQLPELNKGVATKEKISSYPKKESMVTSSIQEALMNQKLFKSGDTRFFGRDKYSDPQLKNWEIHKDEFTTRIVDRNTDIVEYFNRFDLRFINVGKSNFCMLQAVPTDDSYQNYYINIQRIASTPKNPGVLGTDPYIASDFIVTRLSSQLVFYSTSDLVNSSVYSPKFYRTIDPNHLDIGLCRNLLTNELGTYWRKNGYFYGAISKDLSELIVRRNASGYLRYARQIFGYTNSLIIYTTKVSNKEYLNICSLDPIMNQSIYRIQGICKSVEALSDCAVLALFGADANNNTDIWKLIKFVAKSDLSGFEVKIYPLGYDYQGDWRKIDTFTNVGRVVNNQPVKPIMHPTNGYVPVLYNYNNNSATLVL